MKKAQRAEAEKKIRERYLAIKDSLNERARRLFVASEAKACGHGGIAAASRATGMAPSVIGGGIKELKAIEDLEPHEFHGEWNYTIHPSAASL